MIVSNCSWLAPGQIVYPSRHTFKDLNGISWQAIAFRRIRPAGDTSFNLRLVMDSNVMTPTPHSKFSPNNVTAHELRDRQSQLILLDVRTGWEYQWKHIPGARRLDLQRILAEVPKNQPVAVICLSGHRSVPMAKWLTQQGYEQVYNLNGGFLQWWWAGYPTVSGPEP